MSVTVVTGHPGVGKTTFVADNKGEGDLVWDYDAAAGALGFPDYPRPRDVHALLSDLFRRVTGYASVTTARSCWLIVAEEEWGQRLLEENPDWTLVNLG